MQSRQWPGTHARMPRMLHPACRRPSSQRRLSPLDEPRTRALSHHRRPIPTHATPPLLLRQSSTRGVHIRRPISAPRSKRPARGAPLEALPVGSPPLRATDHRTPDACNRDSPFDLCAAIGTPCHARQAMRRSHAPQHTVRRPPPGAGEPRAASPSLTSASSLATQPERSALSPPLTTTRHVSHAARRRRPTALRRTPHVGPGATWLAFTLPSGVLEGSAPSAESVEPSRALRRIE